MTFSKRYEKKEMKDKAEDILKKVGMDNKASQKVKTLSGGEKQRVAIARSIVNKPKIILADEPTGNLDYKNGVKIMDLLKQIAKDERATLLVITHNHSQLDMFDEVIDVEKINKAL
jgi:ABC-type lipoprotein export system ATPase subunit